MKHLKDDELDVHRPKEASIEAKKNDKVSSKPHTSFNEKNDDTNQVKHQGKVWGNIPQSQAIQEEEDSSREESNLLKKSSLEVGSSDERSVDEDIKVLSFELAQNPDDGK